MNTTINQLENLPLFKWASRHPRLAAWIVLSVGIVILVVIEARNVGLLATQWLALVAACVLVAGACVWIISWEDTDEVESAAAITEAAPQTEQPETSASGDAAAVDVVQADVQPPADQNADQDGDA